MNFWWTIFILMEWNIFFNMKILNFVRWIIKSWLLIGSRWNYCAMIVMRGWKRILWKFQWVELIRMNIKLSEENFSTFCGIFLGILFIFLENILKVFFLHLKSPLQKKIQVHNTLKFNFFPPFFNKINFHLPHLI